MQMMKNQWAYGFMSPAYVKKFEKEGLGYFREFVKNWRPSSISEREREEIWHAFWKNVLECYEGRWDP